MENAKALLAHLQVALDIADTQDDHLISAHLSLPMQILADRIAHGEPPTEPDRPKNHA